MSLKRVMAKVKGKVRREQRKRAESSARHTVLRINATTKKTSETERRADLTEKRFAAEQAKRRADARLTAARLKRKKAQKPSAFAKGAKSAGKSLAKGGLQLLKSARKYYKV